MELIAQIDALHADADRVATLASPYFEFIPIRLVTTLEVFVRGVIAELVNGGQQYFERGVRLAKNAKIDLAFAAHVDRRELTVGDFIAHAVSINNIEAVFSNFDTLFGEFGTKIKTIHSRWSEERDEWPLPPIINDYDSMLASLSGLFDVRHVLTHELPSSRVFDPAEASRLTVAVRTFIEATDWLVVEALHGSVARTQAGMTTSADDSLHAEEVRMTAVLEEVVALNGMNRDAFHALQSAWARWADEQASFVAAQFEGGPMQPMVWASEKAALTRERIDQLIRLKGEWSSL